MRRARQDEIPSVMMAAMDDASCRRTQQERMDALLLLSVKDDDFLAHHGEYEEQRDDEASTELLVHVDAMHMERPRGGTPDHGRSSNERKRSS